VFHAARSHSSIGFGCAQHKVELYLRLFFNRQGAV